MLVSDSNGGGRLCMLHRGVDTRLSMDGRGGYQGVRKLTMGYLMGCIYK